MAWSVAAQKDFHNNEVDRYVQVTELNEQNSLSYRLYNTIRRRWEGKLVYGGCSQPI